MLSPLFAQTLTQQRPRFNALFAEARHYRPRLEGAAFLDVLRRLVAPIVAAVENTVPSQAAAVTETLYELALDLLGQEFLGPHSRYPALVAGWQQLLPQLPQFVAAAPRSFVGAITNALYQLSLTPGARPAEWLTHLQALAAHCADGPMLLTAGQVAAWRAGMAHYRVSALQQCAILPPVVGRVALGLPPSADPLASVLARLQADPWLHPAAAEQPPNPKPQLQLMAQVGAFRGLGGLFLTPPRVLVVAEQMVVQAHTEQWALFADACGHTFHRIDLETSAPSKSAVKVDGSGQVRWGQQQGVFPQVAPVSSSAATATTLALTSALSHAVFLLAVR